MPLSFEEAVADAISTVRLVPRWSLAPDSWPNAEAALGQLHEAIASGRAAEVRRARVALEDLGPTRLAAISREGSVSPPRRDPPPATVLELVNSLVHPSGGWATAPRSPASTDR